MAHVLSPKPGSAGVQYVVALRNACLKEAAQILVPRGPYELCNQYLLRFRTLAAEHGLVDLMSALCDLILSGSASKCMLCPSCQCSTIRRWAGSMCVALSVMTAAMRMCAVIAAAEPAIALHE